MIHRDYRAGFAVEPANNRIILRSQFHARHILQPHDAAIRRFAHDDLPEIFRRRAPPARADRIRVFLTVRRRLAADLTRRIHGVLSLDGADDLGHGDAELGQLIGLDPKPHRILTGAKYLDAADARHSRQLIVKVDVGVIGKEFAIEDAIRRIEAEQHQRCGQSLLHRYAKGVHFGGKLRRGKRRTQLGQNQIGVGIRVHVEIDDHSHLAFSGCVQRVHVVHVVHTAHLLLDRRGNGLLDGLCVGACVNSGDLHLGRSNLGEQSDGQSGDGHCAGNHGQDRDHHRHNRTADEESGHGLLSLRFRRCGIGFGIDRHACTNFLDAFGDHALAGLQSLVNNPQITDPIAGLHVPYADLVLAVDYGNLVRALHL